MEKLIIKNKFSKSDYDIYTTYECGISLLGWEVKSIRAKNIKLQNAFCSISLKNELWLNNANIAQYMLVKCDPYRSRKLLLHKNEILKIKLLIKNNINKNKKYLILIKFKFKSNTLVHL